MNRLAQLAIPPLVSALLRARSAALTGLVSAALASGCATMPAPATDSGALGRADTALRAAEPTWSVQLRATPDQVRVGDALRFEVASARSGYFYLYQVSTEGKLSLVFPNSMDAANAVTGGGLAIPGPTWALRARGPAGTGYFLGVVTAHQQDLIAIGEQVNREIAPRVNGPYGAAMVTVRETQ